MTKTIEEQFAERFPDHTFSLKMNRRKLIPRIVSELEGTGNNTIAELASSLGVSGDDVMCAVAISRFEGYPRTINQGKNAHGQTTYSVGEKRPLSRLTRSQRKVLDTLTNTPTPVKAISSQLAEEMCHLSVYKALVFLCDRPLDNYSFVVRRIPWHGIGRPSSAFYTASPDAPAAAVTVKNTIHKRVLAVLSDIPSTVEELRFRMLDDGQQPISRVSVFKVLDMLVESGAVCDDFVRGKTKPLRAFYLAPKKELDMSTDDSTY